jgi:hypothetical protein
MRASGEHREANTDEVALQKEHEACRAAVALGGEIAPRRQNIYS